MPRVYSDESERLSQADAQGRAGRWAPALEIYREVLTRKPRDVIVRQKAAEALAHLGNAMEAIAELQHIAGQLAADGLLLRAMAICRLILEIDPRHDETQRALAELATRKKSGGGSVTLPLSMSAGVGAGASHTAGTPLPNAPRPPPPPPPTAEVRSSEIAGWSEMFEVCDELIVSEAPDAGLPEPVRTPSGAMQLDVTRLPLTPLFSDLPAAALMRLMQRLHLQRTPAGEVIIREGDPGESMFVVVHGRVAVTRTREEGGQLTVAELAAGAFFGEMALLTRAPRLATVVALDDCLLLELTRGVVDEICVDHPTVRAVIADFHHNRLLANLVRASPVFRSIREEHRAELMARFETLPVEADTLLLQQGERGDGLFLLLRGRCGASVVEDDGSLTVLPDMREGDVFGEISLYFDAPVTATVKTLTASVVMKLGRDAFARYIRPDAALRDVLFEVGSRRLRRAGLMSVLDVDMAVLESEKTR